jgi:hypothetical protein
MAGNPHQPENEQHRAENVDHNRSLRDLFAPVMINSSSCIVLHLPMPLILISSLTSSNSFPHSMA